jgi:methionyl-tRNA synthetase
LISQSKWDTRLKLKYLEYLSREFIENPVISYQYPYGIKITTINAEAKYLTIWFEAIWCLFTGIAVNNNTNLSGVIKILNDPNVTVIPFMGQDTEFYYAIGLSLVMLGLGIQVIPSYISVQRFVKLNGEKFSSSRNHIITLEELLKLYPIDIIRYYSISILKPYLLNNNNFSKEKLADFYEKWRLIENKIYKIVANNSNNIPSKNENKLKKILINYHNAAEIICFYEMHKAIEKVINILLKEKEDNNLSIEVASLLMMLKPIMPNISESIGIFIYGQKWLSMNFDSVFKNL